MRVQKIYLLKGILPHSRCIHNRLIDPTFKEVPLGDRLNLKTATGFEVYNNHNQKYVFIFKTSARFKSATTYWFTPMTTSNFLYLSLSVLSSVVKRQDFPNPMSKQSNNLAYYVVLPICFQPS